MTFYCVQTICLPNLLSVRQMKSIPKDLILRIEYLNVSRYQCTALASPNRYGKRYEMRDLTDLREGDEKVSPVAISRQAFAGPLLSVIVGW
jgi:hypothetical protein